MEISEEIQKEVFGERYELSKEEYSAEFITLNIMSVIHPYKGEEHLKLKSEMIDIYGWVRGLESWAFSNGWCKAKTNEYSRGAWQNKKKYKKLID